MQDTLGEYRFNRVIIKAAGDVYVYEFVKGDDAKDVVWSRLSAYRPHQRDR